jgi:hypothetical protein
MVSAQGLLWWGLAVVALYHLSRSETAAEFFKAVIERIKGK